MGWGQKMSSIFVCKYIFLEFVSVYHLYFSSGFCFNLLINEYIFSICIRLYSYYFLLKYKKPWWRTVIFRGTNFLDGRIDCF